MSKKKVHGKVSTTELRDGLAAVKAFTDEEN
jgi:hypothetical protein